MSKSAVFAERFDFMGKRKIAMVFSLLLIIFSVFSLSTKGLSFGIDFTGGTLIEVGYPETADLDRVRGSLSQAGYSDAIVQHFGTSRDVLIRIMPREGVSHTQLGSDVLDTLNQEAGGEVSMRRIEFVGPQIGEELTEDGGLAVIYSLIVILIYVALRFEYRFAFGSIIALVHDVLITLGIFSVAQIEFDLSVLAAVLAVIGYSLNDTIVVFDRIRENFRKMRKGAAQTIVNVSLNQTLSRTLMTSSTTLLVLLALFFMGGGVIHGFSIALIIGVVVGTYSSIYVASSSILAMGVSKADMMPPEKNTEELDEMP